MPFWERFRKKQPFLGQIKEEPQNSDTHVTSENHRSEFDFEHIKLVTQDILPMSELDNKSMIKKAESPTSETSHLVPNASIFKEEKMGGAISSTSFADEDISKFIDRSIERIHIHLSVQEWEAGLSLGQQVLQTYSNAPNLDRVYRLVGDIWQHLGQFEKAIDHYKAALLLSPQDCELHDCLGSLYGKMGDWQKAMACYEEAVTYNPDFTDAYHRLSYAWSQLEHVQQKSQSDSKTVAVPELSTYSAHTSTINEIETSSVQNHLFTDDWQSQQDGEVFLDAQNTSDPLEAYQQALKLDVDFADSHYDLGQTLYRQGDWRGAIDAYKKAIALQPNLLDALIGLGDSFSHLGAWEDATSVYQQALKIDPSSSTAILKLADIIKGNVTPGFSIEHAPASIPEKKQMHNVDELSPTHDSVVSPDSICITEPKQLKNLANVHAILSNTALFDEAYYCSSYKLDQRDLDGLGNWLDHYIQVGIHRGYNPNPLFNTKYFQQQNPDVANLGINPLAHYYAFGRIEQRDPHPLFSHTFYLNEHPDVAATDICPLEHYLAYGAQEGRTAFSNQQFSELLHKSTPPDADYLACWASVTSSVSFANKDRDRQDKSDQDNLQTFGIYCSSEGNYFITEIADHIAAAFESIGHQIFRLTEDDQPPEQCDRLIIVAPHEFFYLGSGQQWSKHPEWWADAIMVNVEQPQTTWFSKAFHFLKQSRLILDISVKSAAMLQDLGLPTYWLPLGYIENYEPFIGTEELPDLLALKGLKRSIRQSRPAIDDPLRDRPIDIHFVGSLNKRRDQFLAKSGSWLNQYRCFMHIPPMQGPLLKGQGQALDTDAVIGLSRRSKILLNIHRDELPYFEWHRIMFHGLWQNTLVVTEPCHDVPGLLPNVHFIASPLSEMEEHIEWLLRSPDGQAEAERIRLSGHLALKQAFPAEQIMNNIIQLINDLEGGQIDD